MRVRTVLGDEREAVRTYADGSISCPYCSSAILAPVPVDPEGFARCPNPGCDANHTISLDTLRQRIAAREAAEVDRADRYRTLQIRMEESARAREAEAEWRTAQIEEALRRGACTRCLFAAGYRRMKFIRHRGPCPRGRKSV